MGEVYHQKDVTGEKPLVLNYHLPLGPSKPQNQKGYRHTEEQLRQVLKKTRTPICLQEGKMRISEESGFPLEEKGQKNDPNE